LSGTAGAKKAAAAAASAAAVADPSTAPASSSSSYSTAKVTTASSASAPTSVTKSDNTTAPTMSASDAGAKLRQAALDAIQGKDKQRQEAEEEKKKKLLEEAEEKATADAEAKKKKMDEEIAAAASKRKTEQDSAAAAAAITTAAAAAAAIKKVASENEAKEEEAPKAAVSETSSSAKAPRSSLASLLSKQEKPIDGVDTTTPTTTVTATDVNAATTTTTTSSKLTSTTTNTGGTKKKKRQVYSKEELLRLRELPVCNVRPADLPEIIITNGPSRGGGIGGGGGTGGAGADREGREARDARRGSQRNAGGGGGGDWQRGAPPPNRRTPQPKDGVVVPGGPPGGPNSGGNGGGNNTNFNNDGGGQWARGQAPPPPPQRAPHPGGRGGGGGRGGRGGGGRGGDQGPGFFDGPVAPLVKSKNGWRPQKETSSLVVAEKKVKGILNKMTKENFARLCDQMCEIPVTSHDILTMMISNVYEKAIDEPSFGEIYGDLCVKLSLHVQSNSFVKIIESDEEPPTEDDQEPAPPAGSSTGGAASSYVVYRWSNDVSTSDSEIVGPFGNVDECLSMALSSETQQDPVKRNNMELELVKLQIKNGVFVKVMKKKTTTTPLASKDATEAMDSPEDGEVTEETVPAATTTPPDEFYTVFFPVSDHVECGQQLSQIFLSERECISDSNKQNSFKRSLLNKCEDEFNKQDIYVDWKKEKAAYEESKGNLSASEQAEKEEELDFRRIKIKKQMLGNIKFIGQLYKKNLLKERIMRFCIASLLKLETKDLKSKLPQYYDTGDTDMDEEDHEALCNMFATIGKTIDRQPVADFMKVCFDKIDKLCVNQTLPMRSRFMYRDLLDLRANGWVPRRKEGKAMTLEEIRKEVEKEERLQAQQSAQAQQNSNTNYRGGGRNDYGGGRTGGGDFRSSNNNNNNNTRQSSYGNNNSNNRSRPGRQNEQTDDDGFATVGGSKPRTSLGQAAQQPQRVLQKGSKPAGFSSLVAEAADLSISSSSPTKASSASSNVPPLDEAKFERRVTAMRIEYQQDPTNLKELMLSFDELSGTENYRTTFVSLTADRIVDVKDDERKAIYSILSVLVENKKISNDDVKDGLASFVEFADSYVYDAPRIFDYLGELLANMIRVRAVDVTWVGEQAEKTKLSDETNPEKIIRALIGAIKAAGGVEAVKGAFGTHQKKLESLLGSAKWAALKKELV
jgi:hypothetical protein